MKPFDIKAKRPLIISGPCSAETEEQTLATCQLIAATGMVDVLRAGIWKPRTKPGCFEGIGTEGLKWLQKVKQQTGMPGSYDTDINIRGLGSPIYVIDGVVRDGSREFQLLNPDDIESISVLKDASAAIYGMNSGNGVIIVKTKSGHASPLKITYDGMVGISAPTSNIPTLNVAQYEELVNEASINVGNGPAYSKEVLSR